MKNENLVKSPLNEALKGCYGSRVYPSQVKKWLVNNVLENTNRKKRVTLSVNGIPGCGKTDVVKSLESVPIEWNGKKYEGFQIVDIPLAQIEEMGDVLGYPVEEIKMLNNGKTHQRLLFYSGLTNNGNATSLLPFFSATVSFPLQVAIRLSKRRHAPSARLASPKVTSVISTSMWAEKIFIAVGEAVSFIEGATGVPTGEPRPVL